MINEMTSSRTDVRAFGGKIPIQHRREFLLEFGARVIRRCWEIQRYTAAALARFSSAFFACACPGKA